MTNPTMKTNKNGCLYLVSVYFFFGGGQGGAYGEYWVRGGEVVGCLFHQVGVMRGVLDGWHGGGRGV